VSVQWHGVMVAGLLVTWVSAQMGVSPNDAAGSEAVRGDAIGKS